MKRPFMAMCIAGVAGITGALMMPVWAGMILLLIYVCILIFMKRTVSETPYGVWLAVFLLVGFCRVWAGRMMTAQSVESHQVLFGADMLFQGRIQKVSEKENSYWLIMSGEDEDLLVIISKTKIPEGIRFYKGQEYHVHGEAKAFLPATNPGQFDEAVYYKSLDIGYKIVARQLSLISEGDLIHRRLRWLEDLRSLMSMYYQTCMSKNGAGVMMASVLGDRSKFGEDIRRVWQQNGWMHLVTVSGLHLSFVAMGIYRRMRKMTVPLAAASILATLTMLAYGYMTDFGDSMIRASIMMFLCIVSVMAGRRYDRATALAFSAFVMLLLRPERLYNSGFLLSFMAIMGTLSERQPLVDGSTYKHLSGWMKLKVKIRESLRLQAGIFLTTLPVIAVTMYEVPVYGFFYNLFMIPLISLVVPLAFATGLMGVIGVGILRGFSNAIMGMIDWILSLIVRLPAKTYVCGCPKGWQLLAYLLLMSVWILSRIWRPDLFQGAIEGTQNDKSGLYALKRQDKNRSAAKQMIFRKYSRKSLSFGKRMLKRILPFLAVFLLIGMRDHKDRILFIDVGQGDGICFMNGDGETVMLDGGSSDVKNVWQYRIAPALKYYGRDCVDVWFLTHGDQDHTSGVHEAITDDTIRIGRIITPKIMESEALRRIQIEALDEGCEVLEIYPGDKLSFGKFELTCIYPEDGEKIVDENDRSLVLSMSYRRQDVPYRALFMGDLGIEGESRLMDKLEKHVTYDLLKAGHHGSRTSTSEEFLACIRPVAAVISCGADNSYGHPHQETLDRLKMAGTMILRTDQLGAVEVILDGRKDVYIYGFKNTRTR